ncbi:MAG: phospholipid carrier-dependent glycosyltransferase, partial [Acidithiobacillales bacterium]
MSSRTWRVPFWPAAGALALAGALVAHDAGRMNSATMDEPFHALAGAEYAISGTYFANLEHPPLAKLLAGVSLRLAGARAPRIPKPFSMRTAEQPGPWAFSGEPLAPRALFRAARLPFYGVFFLLVLAVAAGLRHWAGDLAGLSAAALVAFEPTHLAHAAVVHTDVTASFGFFGTIALTLLAVERRSFLLWGAAGAALGATLAAKFSAVLLVPVVASIALAAVLLDRRKAVREGRVADGRPLRGLLIVGPAALTVLLGSYAVAMRSMSRGDAQAAVRVFLASRGASPATIGRIVTLSRLLPPAGHYAAGLAGIEIQNRTGGGVNYLRGRLSPDGFWDYFFIAFAVKTPVGLLAVLLAGGAALLLGRARLDLTLSAFLFPALYLFVSGMATSYNIGVRHMLPAVPLLVAAAVLSLVRALTA